MYSYLHIDYHVKLDYFSKHIQLKLFSIYLNF